MAVRKVSHLQETQKSDQQQQAKTIERCRDDLNEIGYLANSLIWIGDTLKKEGSAVDEGVLVKFSALAIANLVDEVIGRLPDSEQLEGGAA
jgi:hypothetical protein